MLFLCNTEWMKEIHWRSCFTKIYLVASDSHFWPPDTRLMTATQEWLAVLLLCIITKICPKKPTKLSCYQAVPSRVSHFKFKITSKIKWRPRLKNTFGKREIKLQYIWGIMICQEFVKCSFNWFYYLTFCFRIDKLWGIVFHLDRW